MDTREETQAKEPPAPRRISPARRGRIIEAWASCLAKVRRTEGSQKIYDGTMIVNLVLAEVRDWMRGENRYLPPQLETQISLWVSGQYLPLYLTAQNGLERFLAVIEDKILNGWVFGNTKEEHPWSRKLSLEVRGQMLDEWQKASWRDCSGVVTTVLGNYLMSHFFFGDEKGDDEVHEIFAEVMKDFGNSDLDEFFAQFEGRVLNHPRLKERPPRSSDQEELFGT